MDLDERDEELLALICICGDFPCSVLSELNGGRTWKYKTLQRFMKEGMIKRYKKDGTSSLRLMLRGGKVLLNMNGERYSPYLREANRYRQSDRQKRQRIHDIAVAKVLAYNAGLMVFPDQKPAIFNHPPDPGMSYEFQKACFYDSFEIKAQHDEAVKIKSTRAVGCILTPRSGYFVYSVADRVIKWTSASERKLFNVVEGMLLNWQIHFNHWEAIMIGQDYETAYKQLISDGGYRNIYFRLDQTYPAFYFITNDKKGEVLLRLICQPKARKRLRQYLLHYFAFTAVNDDTVFNCDAKKDGIYVLLAYEFDMEKLKQFKSGLEQFEENGLVICLEEQKVVLKRYFGELAQIETIPLSLIEKALADG